MKLTCLFVVSVVGIVLSEEYQIYNNYGLPLGKVVKKPTFESTYDPLKYATKRVEILQNQADAISNSIEKIGKTFQNTIGEIETPQSRQKYYSQNSGIAFSTICDEQYVKKIDVVYGIIDSLKKRETEYQGLLVDSHKMTREAIGMLNEYNEAYLLQKAEIDSLQNVIRANPYKNIKRLDDVLSPAEMDSLKNILGH